MTLFGRGPLLEYVRLMAQQPIPADAPQARKIGSNLVVVVPDAQIERQFSDVRDDSKIKDKKI